MTCFLIHRLGLPYFCFKAFKLAPVSSLGILTPEFCFLSFNSAFNAAVERCKPASQHSPTPELLSIHMLYNIVAKLRAFNFGRPIHQAGEVISNSFARDGLIQSLDDQVGGFCPAKVPQHHFPRENY
jgi:hypothetical protein